MKQLSLQGVLEGIEDTRRERSVWYPLHEVLFIMLTTVICGAMSYAKIEMFGKSKERWRKKYIKLENGVPDACIFRNVIKAIATQQLHAVFVEWMRSVVENVTGVVAIDGKQARRTKDARKPPLYVVSALIAKKVTEKGADYILARKENQKTFYEDVRLFFEEYRMNPADLDPACCAVSHSQGHGRFEKRTCYICEDIGWLNGRLKLETSCERQLLRSAVQVSSG